MIGEPHHAQDALYRLCGIFLSEIPLPQSLGDKPRKASRGVFGFLRIGTPSEGKHHFPILPPLYRVLYEPFLIALAPDMSFAVDAQRFINVRKSAVKIAGEDVTSTQVGVGLIHTSFDLLLGKHRFDCLAVLASLVIGDSQVVIVSKIVRMYF